MGLANVEINLSRKLHESELKLNGVVVPFQAIKIEQDIHNGNPIITIKLPAKIVRGKIEGELKPYLTG